MNSKCFIGGVRVHLTTWRWDYSWIGDWVVVIETRICIICSERERYSEREGLPAHNHNTLYMYEVYSTNLQGRGWGPRHVDLHVVREEGITGCDTK